MALSILNNVASLVAQNQLTITSGKLERTLFRLASGSRINSGADDAAGLAIADGLRANITALTQSGRNANDGIGALQVADGALAQVTTLLNRAVTLATQSATGTISDSQRVALDAEFQQILAEINRVGTTTTFNGRQVFQGGTVVADPTTQLSNLLSPTATFGDAQTLVLNNGLGAAVTFTTLDSRREQTGTGILNASTLVGGTQLTVSDSASTPNTISFTATEGATQQTSSGITGGSTTVQGGLTFTVSDAAATPNTVTYNTLNQIQTIDGAVVFDAAADDFNGGAITIGSDLNGITITIADVTAITDGNSNSRIDLTDLAAAINNDAGNVGGQLVATEDGSTLTVEDSLGGTVTFAVLSLTLLDDTDASTQNFQTVAETQGLSTLTDVSAAVAADASFTSSIDGSGNVVIGSVNSTAVSFTADTIVSPSGGATLAFTDSGTINTLADIASAIDANLNFAAQVTADDRLIITSADGSQVTFTTNTIADTNGGNTLSFSATGTQDTLSTFATSVNDNLNFEAITEVVGASSRLNINTSSDNGTLTIGANSLIINSVATTFSQGTTETDIPKVEVFLSDAISSSLIGTSIGGLDAGRNLNLDPQAVSLLSGEAARGVLTQINTAIGTVANTRGQLGAQINRLQSARNVINSQIQNLTGAEDGIRAADIAEEVGNLSRFSILNQTGIAALAQANSSQQNVLALLR